MERDKSFGFNDFFGYPQKSVKPQKKASPRAELNTAQPQSAEVKLAQPQSAELKTAQPQSVTSQTMKTTSRKKKTKVGLPTCINISKKHVDHPKRVQATSAKRSNRARRRQKSSTKGKRKLCTPLKYYSWKHSAGNTLTTSRQTELDLPSPHLEDEQEYPVCILVQLSKAAPSLQHHSLSYECDDADSAPVDILVR